jgi:hypothetical protein
VTRYRDRMNITWWVPLGAAAIALLGVIVGQLMSALIEGRRHRNEIRRRDFEHWRDKKFEAYREFLHLCRSWMNKIVIYAYSKELASTIGERESCDDADRILAEVIHGQSNSLAESLREIVDSLCQCAGIIQLVGSNDWNRITLEIQLTTLNMYTMVLKQSSANPFPHEQIANFLEEWLPSKLHALQLAARDELDIQL